MWAFLTFNHKPEVLTSSLWLGRTSTSNVVIPSGRLLMKPLLRISSLLFVLFCWSACSLPPQNCRSCVKQGCVVYFYAGFGTPSFAAPYFQFLQVQTVTSDSSALCDCCILLQPHPPNTLKIRVSSEDGWMWISSIMFTFSQKSYSFQAYLLLVPPWSLQTFSFFLVSEFIIVINREIGYSDNSYCTININWYPKLLLLTVLLLTF